MLRFIAVVVVVSCAFGQDASLTDREKLLLDRVEKLERRIAALEAHSGPAAPGPSTTGHPAAENTPTMQTPAAPQQDTPSAPGLPPGVTINGNLDGYYGYNFNRPVGRANLLRANDVLSNNFTLNQADLILERAPDVSAGRRLGLRVDLMFGQNTETLQGSAANEPRPQVYRNLFQAYGTYIIPAGSGLTVDFGKFASSLGFENNYAKDQINYSRSYYFNYLPFYHMGVRATYALSPKLSVQYWLVNGANQTESFNNFKSNAILVAITPSKSISWNVNYFFGEQGRDVATDLNPGLPALPTEPGLSTQGIVPAPNGREHIFDTYASWNATTRLQVAAEADYVVNRAFLRSRPAHVAGGVGYLKYQLTPKLFGAGRFEYLTDRGGLFSGTTQALKEATASLAYQPANGFQIRWELRRDWSNVPFFLTARPGVLKKEQDTASLALIWWFGGKQGAW